MVGTTHYTAPPQRRRTSPALIILLVVMAVGALIVAAAVVMVAGGGGAPAGAATHPAGATVTDDGFTFHVAGVKLREHIKSDAGDTDTAKGQYVLVSLDVTNTGNKPRFVFADDQQLRAGGKTYAVDTTATVDSDKGDEVGLPEKINPGATERIVVVYDVPAAATPEAIELHGAQDSGGALVALPAA